MNMDYKILYIEDQLPESIASDLSNLGLDVSTNNADDFENVLMDFNSKFDAFILDYRLTANRGNVDAPTYAQTLRTKSNKINHQDVPIILISNEENFVEIFDDFTSQDLFDFTITKEKFRSDMPGFVKKISAFIKAYKSIEENSFDLNKILSIDTSAPIEVKLDSRFLDIFNKAPGKNIYKFSQTICNELIRKIGSLIGEDVLSARLGVSKDSPDWNSLLAKLEQFKYKGIFSDYYNRWWMDDILNWWSSITEGKSLRRLTASDRVKILNEYLHLTLIPNEPIKFCNSTSFWTICMETKCPLDPSEGYVILKNDIAPWQEPQYLSLYAALEQSSYRKYLSPLDKTEIRKLGKDAKI